MERIGQAHVLGNDIDTDQIFPGKYLHLDVAEFGDHALEGYDDRFPAAIDPGDVIVAGRNFGMGSSRESAPRALKAAGVGAVVAESFARIFYRNCINIGLPLTEVADITDHVADGDTIRVDLDAGEVENVATGETFPASRLPPYLQDVLDAGGLVEYRRQQRAEG